MASPDVLTAPAWLAKYVFFITLSVLRRTKPNIIKLSCQNDVIILNNKQESNNFLLLGKQWCPHLGCLGFVLFFFKWILFLEYNIHIEVCTKHKWTAWWIFTKWNRITRAPETLSCPVPADHFFSSSSSFFFKAQFISSGATGAHRQGQQTPLTD